MGLDDGAADRQAQPEALRLGGDEGPERVLRHRGIEPRAVVLHRKLAPAVRAPPVEIVIVRRGAGSPAMASAALSIRFSSTCLIWGRLARTIRASGASRRSARTSRISSSLPMSRTAVSAIRLRSTRSISGGSPAISRRRSTMRRAARRSSSAMSARIAAISSRSAGSRERSCAPASVLARIAASGWFSSCAIAPDSSPSCATRETWAISARRAAASRSAARRRRPWSASAAIVPDCSNTSAAAARICSR